MKSLEVLVYSAIEDNFCDFSKGPGVIPELDISRALYHCSGGVFFQNVNAAKECVKRNIKYNDAAGGCRHVDISLSSEDDLSSDLSACTPAKKITVSFLPVQYAFSLVTMALLLLDRYLFVCCSACSRLNILKLLVYS